MFADKLRALRKQKGVTQEQLAEAIGVERSSIGKYEGKGKDGKPIMPSDDVKLRIAEYFGVSIDYLLDYDVREATIQAIKNDTPFPEMIKPSDYDFVRNLLDVPREDRQRVLDFAAGLKSSKKE